MCQQHHNSSASCLTLTLLLPTHTHHPPPLFCLCMFFLFFSICATLRLTCHSFTVTWHLLSSISIWVPYRSLEVCSISVRVRVNMHVLRCVCVCVTCVTSSTWSDTYIYIFVFKLSMNLLNDIWQMVFCVLVTRNLPTWLLSFDLSSWVLYCCKLFISRRWLQRRGHLFAAFQWVRVVIWIYLFSGRGGPLFIDQPHSL